MPRRRGIRRLGLRLAAAQERALLLMSLRQFANASGDLPVDFDALIREAFGSALDELRMQELR